jgi:hypothetical protein
MGRTPGPQTHDPFFEVLPARTPGSLGRGDAGDPDANAKRGETPGSTGINDAGAELACGAGTLKSGIKVRVLDRRLVEDQNIQARFAEHRFWDIVVNAETIPQIMSLILEKSDYAPISRLVFFTHGRGEGNSLSMGPDWDGIGFSSSPFEHDNVAEFSRLKGHFTKQGLIVLSACNIARNGAVEVPNSSSNGRFPFANGRELIREISAWADVPVRACDAHVRPLGYKADIDDPPTSNIRSVSFYQEDEKGRDLKIDPEDEKWGSVWTAYPNGGVYRFADKVF